MSQSCFNEKTFKEAMENPKIKKLIFYKNNYIHGFTILLQSIEDAKIGFINTSFYKNKLKEHPEKQFYYVAAIHLNSNSKYKEIKLFIEFLIQHTTIDQNSFVTFDNSENTVDILNKVIKKISEKSKMPLHHTTLDKQATHAFWRKE